MSQVIQRLEQEILASTDENQRAEFRARIAGHLARLGNFQNARKIINELRVVYQDGRSGRVTVWIMLAEGLLHFFEAFGPQALDRFRGAQTLALAMRYPTMIATASAWKAHFEFEQGDYELMTESLRIAIAHAAESDLDAKIRTTIIICNCLSICSASEESQKWFMKARDYAIQAGDQASIDALLCNRAVLLITKVRADNCIGPLLAGKIAAARMEIETAKNYHQLAKNSTFSNHLHLWDARLLMLESKFPIAIEKLKLTRNLTPFDDHNFTQEYIDLEIAYCETRTRAQTHSLDQYRSQLSLVVDNLDVDEQLVCAWMQHEIAKSLELPELAAEKFSKITLLGKTYELAMSSLKSRIDSLMPF